MVIDRKEAMMEMKTETEQLMKDTYLQTRMKMMMRRQGAMKVNSYL